MVQHWIPAGCCGFSGKAWPGSKFNKPFDLYGNLPEYWASLVPRGRKSGKMPAYKHENAFY